jgi:oxygen-independent coproporphyrinogen-3 oxidase
MDGITRELCIQHGLRQYEISNFAKPGCECRHNLNYWRNGQYLGCGAGAVSYTGGVREKRVADPLAYCMAVEKGGELIVEKETLSRIDSFKETVVMGLRLKAGISEARLKKRYGLNLREVYGATLEDLADCGLILYDGLRLLLTETGRRFANQVMAELV